MKTIVLIGPSQNGKSTLGNFLHSSCVDSKTAKFAMGDGLRSKTTLPAYADCEYEFEDMIISKPSSIKSKISSAVKQEPEVTKIVLKETVRILDTPGVGDTNPDTETKNLLSFYETLLEMTKSGQEVSCAVLVAKFPNLLNETYKANLQFYTKLFPQLFRKNVVLVITGVSSEESWRRKLSKSGVNVEGTLEEMRNEIKTILKLKHLLPTFFVELLADEEENDFKVARDARKSIFDRCFKLGGLKLDSLTFPKPIPWANADAKGIDTLQGRKTGITKGLEIANSKDAKLSSQLSLIVSELMEISSKIDKKSEELQNLDNDNQVTIYEDQYSDGWHFFWKSSQNFDVCTDHDIVSKVWTGGVAEYDNDLKRHISGTVYKGWLQTLNATLTVSTSNRLHYADKITELKSWLENQERERNFKNQQKRELEDSNSENNRERENLINELAEIEKAITKLSAPFVTIEDMAKRLKDK